MTRQRPIRILYVDNTFTFGGAINALAHLLSALNRERFEPIVLTAQSQEVCDRWFPGMRTVQWGLRPSWADDGLHRRIIQLPGLSGGPLRWGYNKLRAARRVLFKDLPAALKLTSFLRREAIDVVHLNNGVNGMVAPLAAAKLLGIPVVAHARGPGTQSTAPWLANAPDQWIAVSDFIRGTVRAAGVDPDRISVVHDAIDLAAYLPGEPRLGLRAELGVPEGAAVFGVFGRIIPWKGIREFIAAADRVHAVVPHAVALIVGDRSDGSETYYAEVVGLASESHAPDRIIFTGFRDDVADLMRLCDVVVHTSIEPEPFGMTVIEGMATGTAVVAANSGGPTEILEDGETGLLADPSDPEALSAAIIGLLTSPGRLERMGEKAAARARDHYSSTRYAEDVERVYERIHAPKDPAPPASVVEQVSHSSNRGS